MQNKTHPFHESHSPPLEASPSSLKGERRNLSLAIVFGFQWDPAKPSPVYSLMNGGQESCQRDHP